MNIQDYFKIIRDRWVSVLVITVVAICGSLAVYLIRPAEYTASISLYVSAQVGDNPQQAYQGAQLSEQRVKSYNELVTSDRVLGETILRLNLDTTPQKLASSIGSSSALDSVIINITATSRSALQAAAIANTIGQVVTETVAELERPAAPNGIPPVAVRIVQPATPPTQASSTGILSTAAVGLVIGLLASIAITFLRNTLDNRLRTLAALNHATNLPNLGTIGFDPSVTQRPLTVQDNPQSPRAEAFRQLRTNLQFVDVDNPRKILSFSSALPSEGKTTVVANLAIVIASTGVRVLVIEADLRKPRLSKILGVDRAVGLTSVLSGRLPMRDAIQQWGGGAFDILASGPIPPNPSELLSSGQMRALIGHARDSYEMVLVDTPPLLPVTDAAAISNITDGTILMCRYNKTTSQQAEIAAQSIRSVSGNLIGTVLTFVPERAGSVSYSNYSYYYGETAQSDRKAQHEDVPRSTAAEGSESTTRISRPQPRPKGSEGIVSPQRRPTN